MESLRKFKKQVFPQEGEKDCESNNLTSTQPKKINKQASTKKKKTKTFIYKCRPNDIGQEKRA